MYNCWKNDCGVSVQKLCDTYGVGLWMMQKELMNFYFLQEKLHRERSNHMKQLRLDDMFKKIVTSEYPVASSTSNVPYTDGETTKQVVILILNFQAFVISFTVPQKF